MNNRIKMNNRNMEALTAPEMATLIETVALELARRGATDRRGLPGSEAHVTSQAAMLMRNLAQTLAVTQDHEYELVDGATGCRRCGQDVMSGIHI